MGLVQCHAIHVAACCYLTTVGAFRAWKKGEKMRAFLLVLALGVAGGPAWATPGGLNVNGCHHAKRVGFHCHPGAVPKGNERERKMQRECKGRANAGACLGYGAR